MENMVLACHKIIEYSFYLLFTLVPLILTPWNYELFEFNKMILTYILTVIIVGAWLIKMVASGRIIFRRTPLDVPLLLFLLFNFLSFIFSIDRHTSLFGYYSRFNGGLLSIISYILLYYAFVSNMSKKQALFSILYSLFSATLVAIYGILEHFGIDAKYWVQDVRNRVFSTLGQPNWLAAYLVGLTPLTWGFALLNSKFKMKNAKFVICHLSFVIYFLCLLYTKSRSGLLGFAVAYLVFWSLAFLKEKKKILKPFLLFTFSILLLSFLGRTALPAFAKATTGNVITPSSEIRKVVWKGAIEIWRHHPILGTGPETFAHSYYWYRPREHNDTSEWDFLYNKAHNEYLNYLATTGVLGLGSYLLLIGAFVWWSLRQIFNFHISQKSRKAGFSIFNLALLAGFVGILVCRFFGFSVITTNLFFFLFPAMALVLASKPQGVNSVPPLRWNFRKYLSIFLILFVICYLLFVICKLWYADFLFAKGEKHVKANAPVQAFNYFQKAANVNKSEPLFKNELSNAASVLALSLYLEDEATAAAQMAQFAIQESDIALQISPYHLNYLKTRTKMFYNLAQFDKKYYQDALETLLHASELAPTDAKVFYNLGVLYHHLGQRNEAIKTMEKTIELKPNYEAAKKKLEGWYNE